jgi:2-polyprenyl-6-methoxyphenol hydroxylase-like FAD-dependent oxidoreductase
MPTNLNILISGAGIAGLTLAYWLRQYGFNPTIIEKRPDLHDQGYMIDFYGSGYDVAEKMDLLEALEGRHYPIPRLEFVDGKGKTQATIPVDKFRKMLGNRAFNFMRGDLANVLYERVKDNVPVHFGTSITRMRELPEKVEVEFSDGTSETYDLVVGAGGIHSKTRELLWGAECQFAHYLGFTVACAVIEDILGNQSAFYSHVEPHKQASVYSIRGNKLATFFAFRSEQYDHLTQQQQLDKLTETFGGMGWIVPQLLEHVRQSPHLFFDAVSQIKIDPWYKGRVALLGDACQCMTLLAGQGASMAMAGAYVLATELEQANGDYQTAFPRYQTRMKPEIDQRQIEAQKLAKSFVPDSYLRIKLMGLFLKVAFLPGFKSIVARQIGAKSIIR